MKFTLEQIRSLCTESSFERGWEYFRQGRVVKLERSENLITAVVSGTDEYHVEVNIHRQDVEASCTCPYDWGGCCKHIVATLLTVCETDDELRTREEKRESRLGVTLDKLSLNELKGFVLSELKRDSYLRERFMIHFSDKSSKPLSLHDYKREIEYLYLEMGGVDGFIRHGKYIDFSPGLDVARRFEEKGNVKQAATIYRALCEVIAENMDRVDDSDGHYADEFAASLTGLVNCMNGMKRPAPGGKRADVEYLFQKYIEGKPDYFREHYAWALREICRSRNDLRYWQGLLQPHLPEDLPNDTEIVDYYLAKDLLMMQLDILSSLNERDKMYGLFDKYYRRDHEFCSLYVTWLDENGNREQAIRIAEEGLTLFPTHLTRKLRRFLDRFYRNHAPDKQKENLLALFALDGKWEDYGTLKELCSEEEWKTMIPTIVEKLEGGRLAHPGLTIQIYLREGMFDDALEIVLAQKSLAGLAQYHDDLAPRYPDRYFEAYTKLIVPFADSGMGRGHYFQIVQYLKKMKEIRGHELETVKIVEFLKQRYDRRPAFQDELRAL